MRSQLISDAECQFCLCLCVPPEVSEIHITVILIPILYENEVHQNNHQKTMKKTPESTDDLGWPAFSKSSHSIWVLATFYNPDLMHSQKQITAVF
jgi:hypothetical protein